MNFNTRKEVTSKISYLKRLLSVHGGSENELLTTYLGADHLQLHRDKILEAIKKLEAIHDTLPYGYFFQGPYYIRSYPDYSTIEKNEPLFLKDGFIMWTTIDPKFTLWNYLKGPYFDKKLSRPVNKEDAVPIYSRQELIDKTTSMN